MTKIELSTLPHTWFIDIDGTILRHNGHLEHHEELLDGVEDFWRKIPTGDTIVLVSGRALEYKEPTLNFLRMKGIWFTDAIFGLPLGERIIFNDIKPGGLRTAIAINVDRNKGLSQISLEEIF